MPQLPGPAEGGHAAAEDGGGSPEAARVREQGPHPAHHQQQPRGGDPRRHRLWKDHAGTLGAAAGRGRVNGGWRSGLGAQGNGMGAVLSAAFMR